MTSVPAHLKLYYILHIDNLPSVVSVGGLLCNREIQARGLARTGIGMPSKGG